MTAYRTLYTAKSLWDFSRHTDRLICSDSGCLFTSLNICFLFYIKWGKGPASRAGTAGLRFVLGPRLVSVWSPLLRASSVLFTQIHTHTHTELEGTQYYSIPSLFYGSYAVLWMTETPDLHPTPAPLAVVACLSVCTVKEEDILNTDLHLTASKSAAQQARFTLKARWCLTYWWSPPVVQGTLQGALLSPAKHRRVNSDLHSPLAA